MSKGGKFIDETAIEILADVILKSLKHPLCTNVDQQYIYWKFVFHDIFLRKEIP